MTYYRPRRVCVYTEWREYPIISSISCVFLREVELCADMWKLDSQSQGCATMYLFYRLALLPL
jgi:hypothetical protein